jgi:hypothetical protein
MTLIMYDPDDSRRRQRNIAHGLATMAVHPDGALCVDGREVHLTHEWGPTVLLRFKMRLDVRLDELIEKDPQLSRPWPRNRRSRDYLADEAS